MTVISRGTAAIRLAALISLLAFSTICLHAQTDKAGNPITEDQLVNHPDYAARGKTTTTYDGTGSTEITRDGSGNATEVKVKDSKGRVRKTIKIRRLDGETSVETIDYRADGTPNRQDLTVYRGDDRQVPVGRYTTIYHPTPGRNAKGEPEGRVMDSWYEEWRDGRFVRGLPPGRTDPLPREDLDIDISGTGETSGHIADLHLTNMSKNAMTLTLPPMILESVSGKTQHYAVPGGQEVAIDPGKTKTVPVEGVCLVRNKPPVADGVTGDLVINDGGSEPVAGSSTKIPSKDAQTMLRIAQGIYEAAKQLEKDGALKSIPYSDPKKKKDIVVQWSTWMNPELSELTGVPPATKEDLQKVVYKQMPGTMTPEKKKKVDEGINAIFEKVELTSEKAKDLEKAQGDELPDMSAVEIADGTGDTGSGSQTREQPIKKKKWPKPIRDWLEKKHQARNADTKMRWAREAYERLRREFFEKSRRHGELEQKNNQAKEKAEAPGATQQDKDDYKKASDDLKKLENDLEKDFQKTPDGQKEFKKFADAERDANNARAAEKEAGKNIDDAMKAIVEEEEAKAVPAFW